jgi:hypothetical protein
MKYIVTTSIALLIASPAFAGGGSRVGGLIGNVTTPITTAVSALNVTALNHVSVLSNDKTTVVAPVSLKNTSVLSGILSGGSHGCGCN